MGTIEARHREVGRGQRLTVVGLGQRLHREDRLTHVDLLVVNANDIVVVVHADLDSMVGADQAILHIINPHDRLRINALSAPEGHPRLTLGPIRRHVSHLHAIQIILHRIAQIGTLRVVHIDSLGRLAFELAGLGRLKGVARLEPFDSNPVVSGELVLRSDGLSIRDIGESIVDPGSFVEQHRAIGNHVAVFIQLDIGLHRFVIEPVAHRHRQAMGLRAIL